MPLQLRKRELKRLIPDQPSALLYVDRIEQHGERLFHLACREDLEGIRDATYGHEFRRRIQSLGMKEVSAPRSPWQNAFVERMIGSIRRVSGSRCGPQSTTPPETAKELLHLLPPFAERIWRWPRTLPNRERS